MAVHKDIQKAGIADLFLDPKNPRLGRQNVQKHLSQDEILNVMQNYSLDELAVSILKSGYWPQEALIVVREKLDRSERLIVVEGNRRLAALKLLQKADSDEDAPEEWKQLLQDHSKSERAAFRRLLGEIPYILADTRKDVQAYLGFRHVTGIKQWDPAEKAEYISQLIESGMTYKDVTDAIGSKVSSVRQNYISFRILVQMEELEGIHVPSVEEKFSVLTLSLRTDGVQSYLGVNLTLDPEKAKKPIPPSKLHHLVKFAQWLFGNKEKDIEPIITDSRKIERFGKVLENAKAVQYLEKNAEPRFETAYRIAGGDAAEVAENLESACYHLEEALGVLHHVKDSARVKDAAERIVKDVHQLLTSYPDLRTIICKDNE